MAKSEVTHTFAKEAVVKCLSISHEKAKSESPHKGKGKKSINDSEREE